MSHTQTPSQALAAWAVSLQWESIPPPSQADCRLRVVDSLGLIAVGRTTSAGRAVTANKADSASSPAADALALGTLAHCRDFDDTFADSVVHPGSVIVPTALALSRSRNSSSEETGAAIVAGYETAARIGAVFGRRLGAKGFHATGVVGPIAAAVTAGKLLSLNEDQMASAIGLACSMSSGLGAFINDGSWSKWMHAGWSAQGGINAAELAFNGFRGPHIVLDGPSNLFAAFAGEQQFDRSPLADFGNVWRGTSADFKYYPCAHVIQPYLDAVIATMASEALQAGDLASIECGIAPWAAAVVAEPCEAKLKFDTELEAIASLPYQVAISALDGRVDLRSLDESNRARADVADLASRVSHLNDDKLTKGFDGYMTFRLKSGRAIRVDVHAAEASETRVVDKFLVNFDIYSRSTFVNQSHAAAARNDAIQAFPKTFLVGNGVDWGAAFDLLDL